MQPIQRFDSKINLSNKNGIFNQYECVHIDTICVCSNSVRQTFIEFALLNFNAMYKTDIYNLCK